MLALSAGVIALIWMMAWRYRTSQAKAVSSVKEDFNMTVFDTGILVHQENGDFRALFSEPTFQVKELEEMFLLDLTRQRIYILPKRCMEEHQLSLIHIYAHGKTNLMEALWLFTGNRSFRGAKESEMIAIVQNYSKLELYF